MADRYFSNDNISKSGPFWILSNALTSLCNVNKSKTMTDKKYISKLLTYVMKFVFDKCGFF